MMRNMEANIHCDTGGGIGWKKLKTREIGGGEKERERVCVCVCDKWKVLDVCDVQMPC